MKRILFLIIISVTASLLISMSLFNDQFANANSLKKIQFTKTITSTQDPGMGSGNEQMAIVLPPNSGSIYHGSITYTASQQVQIIVLHEISKADSKGQPTWTVDGNTFYAKTVIDTNSNGGSLDFTGSALGLHTVNSTEFTATVSIDGWVRTTTPIVTQPVSSVQTTQNFTLKLPKSTIPVTIPLHQGLVDGQTVYYIITDSSNKLVGNTISERQNWKVQTSPVLAHVSNSSVGNIFVFTNGIEGNGTRGFQNDILSFTPNDKQYSPLSKEIDVSWNIGRGPLFLNSTQAILDANTTGKVKLIVTDTILNTPQIVWKNNSLTVRNNKTLTDESSYLGGQVLAIDKGNLTATFVGHRSWGPDGTTIYYIITGGTPEGPANTMRIQNIPALSTLESSSRDLYHFSNGFRGSGLFGYQEGITNSQPGDTAYSPICKISIISWNDPLHAKILENIDDIDTEKSSNEITVQQASIADKNYILDCPIIEHP